VHVISIVAQNPDAVRRYIEETGLAFDILIDAHRDVLRTYGVWHRIGLDAWNIARPAAFLIDQDRRIRYSFVGDQQAEFPSRDDIFRALDSSA
jgi:methyl-accepting chemotaxis protein